MSWARCFGAVALVLLSGACSSGHPATLALPVIREAFTPVACDQKTTVGQLGCAEHDTAAVDAQIYTEAATILVALHDAAAKQRFVLAEQAWLTYRRATCSSRSDQYLGGSEAPVVAATCEAALSRAHLTDLMSFAQDLIEH